MIEEPRIREAAMTCATCIFKDYCESSDDEAPGCGCYEEEGDDCGRKRQNRAYKRHKKIIC